jgi:6-pyruvoyltetrahydropterin/6-carboxytetrahydropterin synthase
VGRFRVMVSKDYLGFAAAHFLTFRGHACEALHGHNYRVSITVEGPVDPECHFVIDFAVLKKLLKNRIEKLDHRVLLPTINPKLGYREADGMTYVTYHGRQSYQFPTADCVMIPIGNTTAEMIAQWLAESAWKELGASGVSLELLDVEVEESPGQAASFSISAGVP